MSQFYQTGTDRAARRGAGTVMFLPPASEVWFDHWHVVETHEGVKTLQWRPGIEIWRSNDGQRWTAESAGSLNWRYVGAAAGTAR